MTDIAVSTHSRLKAAGPAKGRNVTVDAVSTHSRLKAAGRNLCYTKRGFYCFNTQPPEGGWTDAPKPGDIAMWFQHTAA